MLILRAICALNVVKFRYPSSVSVNIWPVAVLPFLITQLYFIISGHENSSSDLDLLTQTSPADFALTSSP